MEEREISRLIITNDDLMKDNRRLIEQNIYLKELIEKLINGGK